MVIQTSIQAMVIHTQKDELFIFSSSLRNDHHYNQDLLNFHLSQLTTVMLVKSLKKYILLSICLCATAYKLLGHSDVFSKRSNIRSLAAEGETNNRPVMHTFYEKSFAKTGMSEDDDRRMLEVWREGWKAAGWDTKILTIHDARKHSEFKKFDMELEKNTHDHYNKLCFIRWLAMAANGGGWMGDYDVFPIPTTETLNVVKEGLPNGGKLTVYEYTRDGGVPSLVSGTAGEWDRVAHILIGRSKDDDLATDMFALIDVHQTEPEAFILEDRILKGHFIMKELKILENNCRAWQGFMAIHMSHYAISVGKQSGRLPQNVGADQRAQVAYNWVKEWISTCGSKLDT